MNDYVSHKSVIILERRLGLLHLSIFSLILAYVVGVRIIFERGYQANEKATGFVNVRLEGVTYTTGGGMVFPADGPELVAPQIESDAMFVPTHITTTRGQIQDNCTDPAQPCSSDVDCMRQPPVAYGLCEDGHCMQLGWCPRPPSEQSRSVVLQNLMDLDVVLLGEISFPQLGGGETLSTEDGKRHVRTRWSLHDIVERSGVSLRTAVEQGLVLSVVLKWTCDLNPGADACVPRLRVYPLAEHRGFVAEWADYYQMRGAGAAERVPTRDLHSAQGLRLLFSSRGTAHRIDLYACVLQLFMALALLPIASTVTDTIMQNLFAERRHYREYKMETTPDFSDVRAKVEALEKQTKSQQQKMLQYDE